MLSFQKIMDDAKVPKIADHWSLESWPKSKDMPDEMMLLRKWVEHSTEYRNVYIHGPWGTGKTGLAIGLMRVRLAHHQPSVFWTAPDLLTRIKATFSPEGGGEQALIEQLRDVDLLVLDDLGAEKPTDWQREKLYQIFNGRMGEDRETIVTSNLVPDQLGSFIGERIAARILYRCLTIEVYGKDLRSEE